jgi:hypothetical protein
MTDEQGESVAHLHGDPECPDGAHLGRDHLSRVPDCARPAVFAARAVLAFDPALHAGALEEALTRFLAALSEGLAAAGCRLVGHIKGVVSAAGRGDLAFHLTALGSTPAVTGGVTGMVAAASLTVTVIAFGVDERALPAIVHGAWSRAAAGEASWPS